MKFYNPFSKKKENKEYKITSKYLTFKFAGGLAGGLGTVVGATLLFALFIFILTQLKVIPIIGDIASQIVELVKEKTE